MAQNIPAPAHLPARENTCVHKHIPLPRGISPLRSGRTLTPVEMTLKNQTNTMSFRASVERSPAIGTERSIPAPAKYPRWLAAERSPAEETKTIIYEYSDTRPRWLTALKPSPLGEGGTSASVSEPERANEGNKPYKNATSFSPHPSCLRDALEIHLPPRGGRLNRLRTRCHFERSREIPCNRNGIKRTRASPLARARITCIHKHYTSSVGDFSAALGWNPHSGRNDIKNSPL